MQRIKAFFLPTVMFALATGCMRPDAVRTADINPLGWRGTDTLRLEAVGKDTISHRAISILFRFDNTFKNKEIPLTVRVTTPDSLWYEEGFTAVLGNPVRANNDFYEAAAPYRHDVVFMREGPYVFEIVNAGGELRGLWGAGIVIE